MNSLRSFVRQSISLGSNAFQEKDKADKSQHEGSSHEGSKISVEDNPAALAASGSFEDDNDVYQEVVENEELDPSTGTWKRCDSDMTKNSAVLEGKMVFPEIKIPDESNYSADDWEVESDSDYDEAGWSYGNDFDELDQGDCLKDFAKGKVRRRIWQRRLKLRNASASQADDGAKTASGKGRSTLSKRGSHRFPIFNAISGKINGAVSGMAQTASASLESAKGVSSGIIQQAGNTLVSATAAAASVQLPTGLGKHHHANASNSHPAPEPTSSTHENALDAPTATASEPISVAASSAASETSSAGTSPRSSTLSSVFGTTPPVDPIPLSASQKPEPAATLSPSRSAHALPTPPTSASQQASPSPALSFAKQTSATLATPSEPSIADDSSSVAGGASVNVDDNAAFEYEDDGGRGDAESVVSEAYSVAPSEMGVGGMPGSGGAQKRRSFFSFGSSSASTVGGPSRVATSPKEGARRQSVKIARDTDPALRVHDATLAAIGKQIKFIEAEAKKAEDEKLKTWKEEVKPHLESTIADLEKRIGVIKQRIEKEADKGYAHVSKLEDDLEKKTVELDVAKRCLYFPYTDITLGTGGVYLALNDFWLEYCSGGYHIEITPDRAFPSISLRLRGVKGKEAAGVQARLQLEGFRLAGDKGKGVPKLNFSQIKVTIGFTADVVLKFNHKLSKWEINSKDFKINVVSFKGPYGINRSIVGLVLSLLTPTIRHQLVDNLPFELGLMIKTMPTSFTIIGDFNVRGVELSTLDQEWYQAQLLAKMCDYSPTQMEMFYYLQRALERSYPMKTCAEFLSYVKQFSKSRSMWEQLVHLWEQAAMLYCEKVAMQKGGSELESLNESGLMGLPGYKISFRTFLGVCEEMLMKRINVKCELKYIDGQFSLNHMVSFMYQIVHRLTSEAAAKATSYKKVRLLALIERLNKNYEETSDIVRIMGQNLNFVQVVVQASARSGPEGSFHALATDICAQAPLSLDLNISAPKSIGALPLIPYVLSFRPQANGDILLEAFHFNHDSSDVPSLLRGLHIPSFSDPRGRSETLASSSSAGGAGVGGGTAANAMTSGGMTFGGEDNFAGRESESDAGMWNNISREHKFTNYENSIRTGVYSTSYNRVVNKIATGQATIRALGLTALRQQRAAEDDDDAIQSVDAQFTGQGLTGFWGLTQAEDAALSEEWKHLLIKREKQWQSLKRTLQDHPRGDEADTLLSVITKRPKISVIVDRKTEFKSGAELVTVNVGKFDKPLTNPSKKSKRQSATGEAAHGETANASVDGPSDEAAAAAIGDDGAAEPVEEDGVPIAVHTAGEIRLFTQIESAEVSLHLPTLLRFVLAHFADLTLLRQYLETLTGLEFLDEHLLVFKMVLERMAKYLLLPVLTLDVNINGKLMALNGEIMILIETPQQPLSPMQRRTNDGQTAASSSPGVKIPDCAVELEAQISLRELLQDAIDIDNLIRFGTGESSK